MFSRHVMREEWRMDQFVVSKERRSTQIQFCGKEDFPDVMQVFGTFMKKILCGFEGFGILFHLQLPTHEVGITPKYCK